MKNFVYAFRYLIKGHGNNVTRIMSLTLGLGLGMMLLAFVSYSFTYDRFFPDSKRIFHLYVQSSLDGNHTNNPRSYYAPLAPALKENIPQVEAATRIYGEMNYDYFYGEESFPMKFYAIDSLFFDVLDYGMVVGNPKDINAGPSNIMLSASMAKTIFGDKDPIGMVMQDQMGNDMVVCGVFNDPPINNHLGKFNMLVSFRHFAETMDMGWNGNNGFMTYIKIRPETNIKDVEAQVKGVVEKYKPYDEESQATETFFFRPIAKVYTSNESFNQYLRLFLMLSFLVIFMAIMNYVLVSISGLVNRSKTIAMLRCNGARKWDVLSIFMSETLMILIIALVITASMLFAFQNQLNQMMNGTATLGELFSFQNIWVTALGLLFMFLVAGLIPSSLFVSIPLTAAFKGVTDSNRRWKLALLSFQLICVSFSISFLTITLVQYDRLQHGDQGYDHDRLVFVNVMGNYGSLINHEDVINALPVVESVGTSYSLPVWAYSNETIYDVNHEVLFSSRTDAVSPDYFATMGMQIVEGRSLTVDSPVSEVLVTEEFVRMHGWDAVSAVGRDVISGDDFAHYTVVGVVKNFRSVAAVGEMLPIIFHNIRQRMPDDNMLYGGFRTMVRLTEMSPENIASVQEIIKQWMSIDNYHVTVYDDVLKERLNGESAFSNVLKLVCIVTFIVALIGLLGYLNDEINRRCKEVAIRKVNGADVKSIILLFARNMAVITCPSLLVGLTLTYFVADSWLEQFINRTPLYWWIFAISILAVMMIVFVTQVIRTWRIANMNPIKMIKTE